MDILKRWQKDTRQLIRSPFKHFAPTTRRLQSWTANLHRVGAVRFPVTGIPSDGYSFERGADDAADRADDKKPREVPRTAENMLRLFCNKIECGGGDLRLVRCIEQLKNTFLGPDANAKQASMTQFVSKKKVSPANYFAFIIKAPLCRGPLVTSNSFDISDLATNFQHFT